VQRENDKTYTINTTCTLSHELFYFMYICMHIDNHVCVCMYAYISTAVFLKKLTVVQLVKTTKEAGPSVKFLTCIW